jgi:hypothetical protein
MKTPNLRWAAVALLLAVSVVHAQSVPDPKIIVQGSGYSQVLHGLTFTVAANAKGGGSASFYNASGLDWGELTLETIMPYGLLDGTWSALDCPRFYDVTSDLFVDSALSFGPSSLTIRLFGLDDEHPGIPFTDEVGEPGKHVESGPRGSHFSINLDNSGTPGAGGWFGSDHKPLVLSATATPAISPVPEPATIGLVLVGLLAIGLPCLRRRSPARRDTA